MKWEHSAPIKHEVLFNILTSIIKTQSDAMLSFKKDNIIYFSSVNNFDNFSKEIQDTADNVILWLKSD